MSIVKPFLRWAGGKRWLAPKLAPIIKQSLSGRYIEPFLGGAAMLFASAPKNSVVGDVNAELINAYKMVTKSPDAVVRAISQMPVNKDKYNEVRSLDCTGSIIRAVRFIYLNRTCYGGIYRTNQDGGFNVPFGGGDRNPEKMLEERLIEKASEFFSEREIDFRVGDFEPLVNLAKEGDVVFCDPTYRSAGRDRFDRYGPTIFGWDDQERLASALRKARDRGATCIVSNAHDEDILSLYGDAMIRVFKRKKAIGNASNNDSKGKEILAILDPEENEKKWRELFDDNSAVNSINNKVSDSAIHSDRDLIPVIGPA